MEETEKQHFKSDENLLEKYFNSINKHFTLWLSPQLGAEYPSLEFILENNIEEAKKNFYKNSLIIILGYQIFQNNLYPNLKKEGVPSFVLRGAFLSSTLSENPAILKDLASIIECYMPSIQPFEKSLTYAIKYFVLEDIENAKMYINQAHQEKYFKLDSKGFSHAVKGIIEYDVNLINEGIEYRLKRHLRENKQGTIFHSFSIEATALAKLAHMYGLEPDISSPFIHKGLLEKTEGIEYEGIQEVMDALEEVNRRAGSFGAKLSGWFKR